MDFQSSARDEASGAKHARENLYCLAAVTIAATAFIGLAFGAIMLLASPDGWVMKAANQAMTMAQQGALASYDIADTH